jgi:hypothetical protein
MKLMTIYALAGVVAVFAGIGCDGTDDDASITGSGGSAGEAAAGSGADAGPGDSGADAETGPSRTFADWEDGRYCEVLIAHAEDEGVLAANVWNSLAFGPCPQEQWEALDADEIKKDFPDAALVMLNGPRFWVLQEISDNSPPQQYEVHTFGEIKMFLVAILRITDPAQAQPYNENRVDRDTTYRFARGNRVFELTGPDGKTYVMQSFSRIVDADLTFEELADLGDRLSLPEGWSFDSRILDEDLVADSNGVATVIQDELKNTYQLVE